MTNAACAVQGFSAAAALSGITVAVYAMGRTAEGHRGQTDVRTRGCDICNRNTHSSFYRGCQKGVDVARIGPLSTIAMPEICPRSLILLAMVAKKQETAC